MIRLTREDQPSIKSVHGFIKQLLALRKPRGSRKMWYRGVSDVTHALVPTIGRDDEFPLGRWRSYDFEQEWQLLHRFRRRSYREVGGLLPAGEALFMARHHGLPTRLLDWTANALYGLYFACLGDPTKSACLWAMLGREDRDYIDGLTVAGISDELSLFAYLDGRFTAYRRTARWEQRRRRLKLLEPPFNSARLLAQDGVFTVHNCPQIPLEEFVDKKFDADDLDIETFFCWKIPAGIKSDLIEQLSGLGITHRTVYPDLDGIAKSLRETELLWSTRDPRHPHRKP